MFHAEDVDDGDVDGVDAGAAAGAFGTASTTADDLAALSSVATVEGALRGEDFAAAVHPTGDTAYSKSKAPFDRSL